MSLWTTLQIAYHDKYLSIDSLENLNKDLWKLFEIQELYRDTCEMGTPIVIWDNYELKIASLWDWELDGYESFTQTNGLLGIDTFQVIANHIIQGKIILYEEIEGNQFEVYVLKPNKVVHYNQYGFFDKISVVL